MSDIESMKAELEAAGYVGEWLAFGSYQEFSFIFGDGIEIHDSDKDNAIEYAYAHYQREKKFAAMEALLEKMIAYLDDSPMPDDMISAWSDDSQKLMVYIDEAKVILGK